MKDKAPKARSIVATSRASHRLLFRSLTFSQDTVKDKVGQAKAQMSGSKDDKEKRKEQRAEM